MKKWIIGALVLSAPAFLGAVSGESDPVYKAKCLKCHGAEGDGTGKAGKIFKKKPTNFTDAKWQDSRTDEQIVEGIKNGGKSKVLKIDKKMPDYGNKLSEAEIASQVKLIRSFKK